MTSTTFLLYVSLNAYGYDNRYRPGLFTSSETLRYDCFVGVFVIGLLIMAHNSASRKSQVWKGSSIH